MSTGYQGLLLDGGGTLSISILMFQSRNIPMFAIFDRKLTIVGIAVLSPRVSQCFQMTKNMRGFYILFECRPDMPSLFSVHI